MMSSCVPDLHCLGVCLACCGLADASRVAFPELSEAAHLTRCMRDRLMLMRCHAGLQSASLGRVEHATAPRPILFTLYSRWLQ
jgi:hypothetical protein